MSVAIPQVDVEIFRGPPGFADDNFVKGWTKTSGGTSAFSTDGDLGYLTKGDQTYCAIEKTLNDLSSDTYSKLQVRIESILNGTWYVQLWEDGVGAVILSGTTSGLFEGTLPVGKVYKRIELKIDGGNVKFDYVFISKTAMLTPAVDLAEQLEIDLPLLEMGVSGATLNIPNSDGTYTNLIGEFDRILIYLYRQGEAQKKVFGGKITEINSKGRQSEYWINLKCMGLGEQLHAPTSLVQKYYSGINGKTIITESLLNCDVLTDKFVDVDNEIASTHNITYDEVLAYEVITEICKKATTIGGVIGFDAYVDAAGNLNVFKRGKYTSSVSLTGKIEEYEFNKDIHRIRNKNKVYGPFNDNAQMPKDENWTESLVEWTLLVGSNLRLDSVNKIVGSYSIAVDCTQLDGGVYWGKIERTFKIERNFICAASFKKGLSFKAYAVDMFGEIFADLMTDDSNYFSKSFGATPNGTWKPCTSLLGEDTGWTTIGNPEWDNLTKIRFRVYFNTSGRTINIDDLRFLGGRYYATAEDSVSIAKYDIRMAEPQIDEELTSDSECQLKAQSLIDFLKEIITSFQNMRVEGNNAFVPGDKQLVQITNDLIDAYFRILEVRHVVDGVNWDTLLTLSNEPKMIDYIHASSAGPRYAGATVIVPRDFSTLQEAVNAVIV